jgi:seryl-tRNA synthetase
MLDFTDTLTLWLFANSAAIIAIIYWLHGNDKKLQANDVDTMEIASMVSELYEFRKESDRAIQLLEETNKSRAREMAECINAMESLLQAHKEIASEAKSISSFSTKLEAKLKAVAKHNKAAMDDSPST